MDALVPVLVVLAFLLIGVAIFGAELVMAHRHLREVRIVRCPAVGRAAALRLEASRSAVAVALGRRPELRVADCTRWPRAQGCDRSCLGELAGDPESATLAARVREWLRIRSCAGCGTPFGAEAPHGIFLVSPLGTRFEWDELPPDWLAEAIESWAPLCARCGRGDSASGTVGETMTGA